AYAARRRGADPGEDAQRRGQQGRSLARVAADVGVVHRRPEVASIAAVGHRDRRAVPAVCEPAGVAEVDDRGVAGAPQDAQADAAGRAVGGDVERQAGVEGVVDGPLLDVGRDGQHFAVVLDVFTRQWRTRPTTRGSGAILEEV